MDIRSTNAGPAVLTATCPDPNPTTAGDACDDAPSTQIEIEFIATTPASLILQASPTSLGSNTGDSRSQQSIVTAVVRDEEGNFVKNQIVNFTLTDVTGGDIFPASATTDSFGKASTVYTAGAATSAKDRVIIEAEVQGTGVDDEVTITVAREALFVALGTGNTIQVVAENQYGQPYKALVTDVNGNPISGARVELSVLPIRYQKGFYTLFFDEDLCLGWGKILTVSPSSTLPNPDNDDRACNNEDVNQNGILDPGEDINNNGELDPENVAAVPATAHHRCLWFCRFYPALSERRTWVEIELSARVTVAGSEGFTRARFFLRGVVDDFNDCDVAPPGQVSPMAWPRRVAATSSTQPIQRAPYSLA